MINIFEVFTIQFFFENNTQGDLPVTHGNICLSCREYHLSEMKVF